MTEPTLTPKERAQKRDAQDRRRVLMLQIMPKNAVVAEIGVWRGLFSKKILKICQPKALHLIDPWSFQPEFSSAIYGNPERPNEPEAVYQRVCEKFRNDARVHIHRQTSDEAFASFPDDYFDWVYIDGNHHAPYIDRDLQNALRTVKPDGIITGDDYSWGRKEGHPCVQTAVDALVASLGSKAEFGLIGNQYVIHLKAEE